MQHKSLFLLVLVLGGCIGSNFDERVDPNAPFPSLHSVPDRPSAPDFTERLEADAQMSVNQREMLEENTLMREKFQVSAPTPCKQSSQKTESTKDPNA